MPEKEQLSDEAVKLLKPDSTWEELHLTQTVPAKHWWQDQIRREGYALALDKIAGPGGRYVAAATLAEPCERKVFINLGAGVKRLWLNGGELYEQPSEFRGYHVGRERIPVVLQTGENSIVIETGNDFVLTVTTDKIW